MTKMTNLIIQEYISRFTEKAPQYPKIFYTQIAQDEHQKKLPYIYNIENFCGLLLEAYLNQKRICIYSDYDTDAITACAVMYWGLIDLGFKASKISTYAPDRFTEGYGLNLKAILELSKKNDLIITVDCGINSVQEANLLAQNNDCKLIITDHHTLQTEVPKADSVVNPRLASFYQENPKEIPPLLEISMAKNYQTVFKNWALITYNEYKKPHLDNSKFLSDSVTGVGVSWFSLVWLNYFFNEILK